VSYWLALTATLALEVPAYGVILRRGAGVALPRSLAAGALVNLASHPIAFLLLMPRLVPALGWVPALAVVETAVWVGEAALLWLWLRRDPDLLGLAALLANVVSLAVGLALIG
jgi:hypothetical protein